MTQYDVFNGDADGICALHQLRLSSPADAVLVTGVKRDIGLLNRVVAEKGDEVVVLDISLDKNRDSLHRILEAGARVRYFDHHFAGEIPDHQELEVHIDPSPEVCTSLLVDGYLGGTYRKWAVVGAFGDNLRASARRAAASLDLTEEQLAALQELGTCLNYNGYGVSLEDLFYPPDELYRRVHPYGDPFDFVAEEPAYQRLRTGYLEDMAKAEELQPEQVGERYALYILPDAPWTRRVSGVFGNDLAQRFPQRAHALLTVLPDGNYRVSVRAPVAKPEGADELCRAFASGGGRKAAAGINRLEAAEFELFAGAFRRAYS